MRKKFLVLLTIIFTLGLTTKIAYADMVEEVDTSESETTEEVVIETDGTDTTTSSTQYFDITLQRDGQSAFGKSVKYTVYITPKIDSEKTQITWDAPTAIDINERHREFVSVYRGQTYEYSAVITPTRSGSYQITVNVIAWQNDVNYTNSTSDMITFSDNLVTDPVDPSYTYGSIAKGLLIVLLCALGIWLLILGGKKGMVALKKWLTPPI